jgi:hypothetical protein
MLQHSPAESRFTERPINASRLRLTYVISALATIVVGLGVSRAGLPLTSAVRDKLGDALWASMIFWWIGATPPRADLWPRAGAAFGICVVVELSQLYHTPALDALRRTTLGHLVLGNGFDPRDLAAYAVGVLVAAVIELLLRRRVSSAPPREVDRTT